MPSLTRRVFVFAAVDGLVLQQRGPRPSQSVKLSYGSADVGPSLKNDGEEDAASKIGFEAFGIVGLLKVSNSSFLISITRRQQVAQVKGSPIYVITEVALTPLASRKEAEKAVLQTRNSLAQRRNTDHGLEDSDSSEDEEDHSAAYSAAMSDDVEDDDPVTNTALAGNTQKTDPTRTSSAVQDVLINKGGYGRFARNWFTKTGWQADQRRHLGLSPELKPIDVSKDGSNETAAPEQVKKQTVRDVATDLLPKLLRTTQILFGTSKSFFFSYDHDITRSFANPSTRSSSDLPLYQDVDPLFFWNRNLISPFIDAGQHSFVMPLMQGFVGQRAFTVDSDPEAARLTRQLTSPSHVEMTDMGATNLPATLSSLPSESPDASQASGDAIEPEKYSRRTFLITLISRRSIERAGLRYLRRGIDEEGHTANFVETEQILSDSNWSPATKTFSFLQIRGSLPIFFSQSPYSFKPVPQLQHSADTNYQAFKLHFTRLASRYGALQATSLVEKHGNEAIVGEQYEKHMTRLNESGGINGTKVGFEWFDFHDACRGMKFENVSLLMDTIGQTLDSFGSTVEANGGLLHIQNGVLRSNCMDCLDRTNVVQSACGRRALETQLKEEGFDLTAQLDQVQQWFNTLWADNGDAISRQYASSDAMKGDFTRTRKRNFQGALKDGVLSLTRFYSGMVNDYFSQAAIDFLLGNASSVIFEDFASNMMSSDPSVNISKMRQQAIDVSTRLVIEDHSEEYIAGWALLTPQQSNTIKSFPFEEAVLLLTDAAIYKCRFDWNMEKVSSFERIELRHVKNVRWGPYVTSTLSPAQADEKRNVGFVITYEASKDDIERLNTRSLSTNLGRSDAELMDGSALSVASALTPVAAVAKKVVIGAAPGKNPEAEKGKEQGPGKKVLAFKALPARSAAQAKEDEEGMPKLTEVEQVKSICCEIERVVEAATTDEEIGQESLKEDKKEPKPLVEQGDIISLAEARKSTGIIEKLGYSLKRMVWA